MYVHIWFVYIHVGSILSSNQDSGPTGVAVSLKVDDGKSQKIKTTTSGKNGVFSFEQVLPGKYTIEASHDKWLIEPAKSNVVVDKDSVQVAKSLTVIGYDVRGRVLSDGEPTKGVKFILYSSSVSKLPAAACNHNDVSKLPMLRNLKPLCHTTSTQTGHFLFPALPCANYFVVPFYHGENNIKFDLAPAEMAFTVSHDSLTLENVSILVK